MVSGAWLVVHAGLLLCWLLLWLLNARGHLNMLILITSLTHVSPALTPAVTPHLCGRARCLLRWSAA
jgi:hypothetical protein